MYLGVTLAFYSEGMRALLLSCLMFAACHSIGPRSLPRDRFNYSAAQIAEYQKNAEEGARIAAVEIQEVSA